MELKYRITVQKYIDGERRGEDTVESYRFDLPECIVRDDFHCDISYLSDCFEMSARRIRDRHWVLPDRDTERRCEILRIIQIRSDKYKLQHNGRHASFIVMNEEDLEVLRRTRFFPEPEVEKKYGVCKPEIFGMEILTSPEIKDRYDIAVY